MPSVGLVLVAAGSGTRLGYGIPKALVAVDGVTLLERALGVARDVTFDSIVVAAPPTHLAEVTAIIDDTDIAAHVVPGGETRADSVRAAVSALPPLDIVLIHDVARAWTPPEVFARVIDAVGAHGDGVVPVLPVTDTVVVLDGDVIDDGTDRSRLAAVQTPQGFPLPRYRELVATADPDATDDSTVWRSAGGTVRTVEGDDRAHKLTTAADLSRFTSTARVGIGTDTHAFGDSAPLWLGCIEWPNDTGLSGHSDGDAVAHALTDALLAAGGLGDIGGLFGTDDPRFSGARGEVFLRGALDALDRAGFTPVSASVQVVGNRPRIGPRRGEMETALREILGVPVSVSATTTDGLGFTGEGKGITAVAVAHVSRR